MLGISRMIYNKSYVISSKLIFSATEQNRTFEHKKGTCQEVGKTLHFVFTSNQYNKNILVENLWIGRQKSLNEKDLNSNP